VTHDLAKGVADRLKKKKKKGNTQKPFRRVVLDVWVGTEAGQWPEIDVGQPQTGSRLCSNFPKGNGEKKESKSIDLQQDDELKIGERWRGSGGGQVLMLSTKYSLHQKSGFLPLSFEPK
jgi:hypothetical protein